MPGRLIAFGQYATGHKHAGIVHAGIMFDSTYIIEALGSGISANDIRVGDKRCGYSVYRPRNAMLGTIAGNLAKLLLDEHYLTKQIEYPAHACQCSSPMDAGATERPRGRLFGRPFTGGDG